MMNINASNSVEAFNELRHQRSLMLYLRQMTGWLSLTLDTDSAVEHATALISKHAPGGTNQNLIDLKRGESTIRELPVGGYSVVIRAPGLESYCVYVEIAAHQTVDVNTSLQKPAPKPPAFKEKLKMFGFKLSDVDERDLIIKDGTSLTFDGTTQSASNMHMLEITTIDQAKAILGNPDQPWLGNIPMFGKMVGTPTSLRALDNMNMLLDQRFAMREYVYGNSKSVIEWKDELNNIIKVNPIFFPVYICSVVEVGLGAVLNIGMTGLVCYKLRVHVWGKVRVIQGPAIIDTCIYERFCNSPLCHIRE